MIKVEDIDYIKDKWIICNNDDILKKLIFRCKAKGYLGNAEHPKLRFPIFVSLNQNNKHILLTLSLEKRPGSIIYYPLNIIF